MQPFRRSRIKCCKNYTERSVEPNCHSYCVKYLAERMALDEENAEYKRKAAVQMGISDQRWGTYLKRLKKK